MSTRCSIRIRKQGKANAYLYHHCDGYPSGVGCELVKYIQGLSDDSDQFKSPHTFALKLSLADEYYREEQEQYSPHGDEEYLYDIDLDAKSVKCYSMNWDEQYDDACIPEREELIPSALNIVDGVVMELRRLLELSGMGYSGEMHIALIGKLNDMAKEAYKI